MSAKLTWEEFKERFNKRGFDGIRLIGMDGEKYGGSHSIIEAECVKHGKFKVESRRLLKAMFGCNECAKEYRNSLQTKTTEEFIQESKERFGNGKFNYDSVVYVNSKTKVELICNEHGAFKVRPSDHLSKMEGCPMCKQSKLERMVSVWLDNMKVTYIPQKRFDWLGNMSLDFYIPSMKLGIECQGKQHFLLGGWSKNFNFDAQIERDIRKKELCEKNGVAVMYMTDVRNVDFDLFRGLYSKNNTFTSTKELFNKIFNIQ